jgi:hypothetical protein
MRSMKLLPILLLATCFVSSCSRSYPPTDLKSSVSAIHQYVDSFQGVSLSEARNRLASAQLSEGDWSKGRFGGRRLIAKFPEYEVRVLFWNGKAITTSVQILSKSKR